MNLGEQSAQHNVGDVLLFRMTRNTCDDSNVSTLLLHSSNTVKHFIYISLVGEWREHSMYNNITIDQTCVQAICYRK